MSTPQATRGQHGGTLVRGGRGISSQANRARGNTRGTTNSPGQGRGASTVGAKSNARAGSPNAEGLLRQLREGTTKRGTNSRTNTGRGEDALDMRWRDETSGLIIHQGAAVRTRRHSILINEVEVAVAVAVVTGLPTTRKRSTQRNRRNQHLLFARPLQRLLLTATS